MRENKPTMRSIGPRRYQLRFLTDLAAQVSGGGTPTQPGTDRRESRAAHARPPRYVWIAAACAMPLIAACNATAPVSGSPLSLAPQGRAERGTTLEFQLLDGATPIPSADASWQVSPSGPNALVRPGQVALGDTGLVTVTARTQSGTTTATIHVFAPPTIVFDMSDVGSSGTLGNRDIYRVALDGQELTRLTASNSDNQLPTAARGSIVFTSFRDGYPALYRVSVTGGPDQRLSALTMSAQQPALSSDGAHLAFIASDSGSNRVWTAAADGSGAAPATASFDPASAEEASPVWNTAGTSLAFVSTAQGNAALARLDLASGLGRMLTDGTTTDLDPSWSTDGASLAFSSTRDGDLGIFVIGVLTGQVQRISPTPSMAGEPTWLADGRLVYTAWSVTGGSSTSQLVWIDPSHPAVVHVIPTPAGNPEHGHEIR
jgi:Tol biopolymer transport system component